MSMQTIQTNDQTIADHPDRRSGVMSIRGAHQRHRCELSGCVICNARLAGCDACGGLEASLTSACAGRRLSRFECDEIAAYRMDIVPDDAGSLVAYAIDAGGGVVRRPVEGNGEEVVSIPAQASIGTDLTVDTRIDLCRQAEALAVSIDGDLTVLLNSGALMECRAGQWRDIGSKLGGRQPLFFQYRADGTLHVLTDQGPALWTGVDIAPLLQTDHAPHATVQR